MTIRSERHVMENESINIVSSFLLPWIVYDLRISDYAFDLYIRIAEINQPVSSETFHIQLKSTKDLNLIENRIALYNFPTKSLKTFEASYEPIYIVLCDLNSKKLYWVNAHDEINRLNNTNKKWKEQKTNTIYFDLPHAEFTKVKLKEDVIRIRKKLIIKHSIKLKENESFENLYQQSEIEKVQEDIFSGKIELKDENLRDFLIADLNFLKIFNIEFDDETKKIKETETTISLYEKIIKHKKIPSGFNIGLLYMRISDLYFILSETRDFELNIKNSIAFNKKALDFFNKKEVTLFYFIIHNNLVLSYKLLYEKDSKIEYLSNQISHLNVILELVEEQKVLLFIGQIYLSIASLYLKIIDKKLELIKNIPTIVQELKNSIKYFEKALEYSLYSRDTKEYALINISIGVLFAALAEFESPVINLKYSEQYLKIGYDIILEGGNLEEISDLKTKLGVIYRGLYNHEKNKDYLEKSINYLNQALEFWNPKEFPWDYATTMKNLAMIYIALGSVENIEENISKALDALNKTSLVFTKKNYPERYAATQFSYFDAYAELYSSKIEPINNIRNAIHTLNLALEIYTLKDFPYNYATAQINLGCTYLILSNYEKQKENIEIALKYFNEAVSVFTLEEYPEDYAQVQYNLGGAFTVLAKVFNKEENLIKAIKSYTQSIKVRTYELQPSKFGLINLYIGDLFRDLIETDEKEEFILAGIEAYNNALKFYTRENFLEYFVIINHNLGILYFFLSRKKDQQSNLEKAKVFLDISFEINLNIMPFKKTKDVNNQAEKNDDLESKIHNIRTFYKLAIKDYKKLKEDPLILKEKERHIHILNALGILYRRLSFFTNNKEELLLAIDYYKDALKISEVRSDDYGIILNNIGQAFYNLSRIEENIKNLKEAFKFYKESLNYLNLEKYNELIKEINKELEMIEKKLISSN